MKRFETFFAAAFLLCATVIGTAIGESDPPEGSAQGNASSPAPPPSSSDAGAAGDTGSSEPGKDTGVPAPGASVEAAGAVAPGAASADGTTPAQGPAASSSVGEATGETAPAKPSEGGVAGSSDSGNSPAAEKPATEPKPGAATEQKPEPRPELVSESKSEPRPETAAEARPESKSEPAAEVKPESKPEPVVESKPEPPKGPPLTAVGVLAGDPALGAEKSGVCAGCHGPDGNSFMGTWPKLAGQVKRHLVKQLLDFRSGNRVDGMMNPMASGLNDDDIQNLAAYFSSQTTSPGTPNPDVARKGERLYMNGRKGVAACRVCHGLKGEGLKGGIPGGVPSVRSQHQDYLVKQLTSFKSGVRTNDWSQVMQTYAGNLSDQEIAELAEFMTSLQN